jgi:hypothetical protein
MDEPIVVGNPQSKKRIVFLDSIPKHLTGLLKMVETIETREMLQARHVPGMGLFDIEPARPCKTKIKYDPGFANRINKNRAKEKAAKKARRKNRK